MSASFGKSARIAALNDALRARLGVPTFGTPQVPGKFVMTRGIMALSPAHQIELWFRVRDYAAFTDENDPYGEHDFGSLELVAGTRIFWKIDYFADNDCEFGAENPDDPATSFRVLTIMLAQEW